MISVPRPRNGDAQKDHPEQNAEAHRACVSHVTSSGTGRGRSIVDAFQIQSKLILIVN